MKGLPSGKRRLVVVFALVCAVSLPAALHAQTSPEQLNQAKALFREGNALLQAGDPERALERFLQSRELVPSGKNTANAAICLERLGRYDEALEMYEELLSRFAKDIDEQDHQNLAPIMASLRRGLGSLDISANVEGLVLVDGKPRGRLPRVTALRVLPGKRRIRVVREGYQSFDRIVEVVAGQTASVDASLEPLAGTGAVRVEVTGGAGAQVVIDGKVRGAAPWEGALKPGVYRLQVITEKLGSKPETLEVLEGKTLLVRVGLKPLGPSLRLSSEPASASLSLDGVPLGHGVWSGRIPLGAYSVRASEPGYFERVISLHVRDVAQGERLSLALTRDPAHPRWPRQIPWHFELGLGASFAYAPTLTGGQEALCPTQCSGSSAALGGRLEVATDLLHDRGLGFELGFGYLLARQQFNRALAGNQTPAPVTYVLVHELLMGGVYGRAAGVAVSRIPKGFTLHSTVGAGLFNAAYEATEAGVAWTSGPIAEVNAYRLEPISQLEPFVTTALAVERKLGPVALSLGLSAWFFPTNGPRFSEARLIVTAPCDAVEPESVGCAKASDLLAAEPVHERYWLLSPELSARYRF